MLDKGIKDFHDRHAYTDAELMALTHSFGDVARQIRAKTDLPIWWAEYYGGTRGPDFVAAHYSSILRHMLQAGSAVALRQMHTDSSTREERMVQMLEQQTRRFTFFACLAIGMSIVAAGAGLLTAWIR